MSMGHSPKMQHFYRDDDKPAKKLRYPISRHIHIFTSQGGAPQAMFVGLKANQRN